MNDGQNSGLERGVDVGKALGLETSASSKEQREQEPDGQGDDDLLVSQEAESLAPEGLSTKEKKGIVRFFIKFGQALEGLDAAIDKIGEGQEEKRIKWAAEKKKEAREWWQLDRKGKFFKGKGEGAKITRIALGCVGTVITVAVCAGVSGLLIRSWELGRAQRELENSGVSVPAEQQKQEIANQQQQIYEADYLRYAKAGLPDEDGDIYQGLGVPGLDNTAHILNGDVQIQTAMRGPSWNFAMYSNETGVLQINDLLVEKIAGQLGVSPVNLKVEWPHLHDDPAYALQYLQAHGVNQAVTNFYQCTTDVYNSDLDKTTWEDRLPGVQACSVQATPIPSSEGKSGGHPKLALPEQQEDVKTSEIAGRIFASNFSLEPKETLVLVNRAVEIAKDIVANHQLPDKDDVQGLLNLAIETGDKLVDYFRQLPGEVQRAVEVRINHITEAHNVDKSVYDNATDAISHLTGGGGWSMATILGVEVGLFVVGAVVTYIKQQKEFGRVKLPTPETIWKRNVSTEKRREVRANRGIPDGYIQAGLLVSPGLFGIGGKVKDELTGRLIDEVSTEVIMSADDILQQTNYYKQLVKLLKQGVSQQVINVITERGLLVKNEKLTIPIIKAEDLLKVTFEMMNNDQLKGVTIRGEPTWYN